MKLKLHVPGLREMEHRQKWLAQPETMSYNRGQGLEADGYDPATGCINFPISDWRYWRDVWLFREPNRYSAYLLDEDSGTFVGEVCYFYDMEADRHGAGVLIAHEHRGRGYGTEGLRLLVERAFSRPEVESLFVDLPLERDRAVRMYLTNGFAEELSGDGMVRLILERKEEKKHD